jgi:hypothetical protein
MLWYVIAFLVSITVAVLVKKFTWNGDWGDFFRAFVKSMIVVSIIATIFAFMVGRNLMFNKQYNTYEVQECRLYAISDNNNLNGMFFLGSGRVSDVLYYYYMYENDQGKYRVGKWSAEDAFLEFSDETPNIKVYTFSLKDSLWGFCSKQRNAYITIPEGSITQNFAIDLQ